MAKPTLILTSLLAAAPLLALAPVTGTATARVRIISQATWQSMQNFSAVSEVRLRGVVEAADGAVLRLRMAFGTVRVELGETTKAQTLRAGEALEVVALKIMVGGAQRLLAMEVKSQI